jgi:hypothetical protein
MDFLENKQISLLLILITICVAIQIVTTYSLIGKLSEQTGFSEHILNIRDVGGSSYIHVEATTEGDLWIYNSSDKTIQFIENPSKTNGKIIANEAKISKNP